MAEEEALIPLLVMYVVTPNEKYKSKEYNSLSPETMSASKSSSKKKSIYNTLTFFQHN